MNRMLVLSALAALGIAGAATAQTTATVPVTARAATGSAPMAVVPVGTPPGLVALRTMNSPPGFALRTVSCTLLNTTREPIRIRRIEIRQVGPDTSTMPDPFNNCPSFASGERLLPDRACFVASLLPQPSFASCHVQYESSNGGAVGSISFIDGDGDEPSPRGTRVILPLQPTP